VMAIAGDCSVYVGSRSWSAGGVARTVRGGVTGNDRIFQSHAARAHADAAASTFRHEARRLVGSTLVDAGVAGLSVIKADRSVLYVDSGAIVISYRTTISETAGAVHAAVKTAVGLAAVAAIAANGKVIGERCGVDDHSPAISEDSATARTAAVASVMTSDTGRTERIAGVSASGSGQVECGVAHCDVTEAVEAS